jgi:hypothetical protein
MSLGTLYPVASSVYVSPLLSENAVLPSVSNVVGICKQINIIVLHQFILFFQIAPHLLSTRAEWTPFQTHCYSENLVSPGIELWTSGSAARKSDH